MRLVQVVCRTFTMLTTSAPAHLPSSGASAELRDAGTLAFISKLEAGGTRRVVPLTADGADRTGSIGLRHVSAWPPRRRRAHWHAGCCSGGRWNGQETQEGAYGSNGVAASDVLAGACEHGPVLRLHRRVRENLRRLSAHDLSDGGDFAVLVCLLVRSAHPTGVVLTAPAVAPDAQRKRYRRCGYCQFQSS